MIRKPQSYLSQTLRFFFLASLLVWAGVAYANLAITPGETSSLSSGETLTVDGDLIIEFDATLSGGTTNGEPAQLRVSGDWTNAGNFIAADSEVHFVGLGTTTKISGNTTFYDLIVDNNAPDSSNKNLEFSENHVQTIRHNLLIDGGSESNAIKLRSTKPGQQYYAFDIAAANSVSVNYVDVQDAVAQNGFISPGNSIDSGRNYRWFEAITPLMLTQTWPNQAKNVATDGFAISLQFSTQVKAVAGKKLIVRKSNGTTVAVVAVDDINKVTIDGNLVAFHPQEQLSPNTSYYVDVEEGAFRKVLGDVPNTHIAGKNDLNFSTARADFSGRRDLTFENGIVPMDRLSVELLDPNGDGLQDESLLNSLIAQIDTTHRRVGYSRFLGERDGGRITHMLDVYHGDSRYEAYIDISVPSDGKPDVLWDIDAMTLEKVNLELTHIVDDRSTTKSNLSLQIGKPLGHPGAEFIGTSTPGLRGISLDANHSYRLWALSGGQLQPVTPWLKTQGDQIEVNPTDYIQPLDIGDNLLILRGSSSLPLPIVIPGTIRITKTANRKEVSVGGIVTYTITAENTGAADLASINIIDNIPPGFKYLSGSAHLDGQKITPSGRGTGVLTFSLNNLDSGKNAITTLRYQLIVGSGTNFGIYTNTAVAAAPSGGFGAALSSEAKVKVKVVPDALFDLATVIGKVFHDRNGNGRQDQGDEPIPYVKIVTTSGQLITTDKDGQYHLAGVTPGRHALRIDERSLPAGSEVTTHKVVIIDVTPGLPVKANFGVRLLDGQKAGPRPMRIEVLASEPQPRLNAKHYGSAVLDILGSVFLRPIEFRLFSNYAAYINTWRLEIRESFSLRLVKTFSGTRETFYQPIYWTGDTKLQLDSQKSYSYQLTVSNGREQSDITKEQVLSIDPWRADMAEGAPNEYVYASWLSAETLGDNTESRQITINGNTVQISGSGFDHVRVIQNNKTLLVVPVFINDPSTAADLLEGGTALNRSNVNNTDLILPRGRIRVEALKNSTIAPSPDKAVHSLNNQQSTHAAASAAGS